MTIDPDSLNAFLANLAGLMGLVLVIYLAVRIGQNAGSRLATANAYATGYRSGWNAGMQHAIDITNLE